MISMKDFTPSSSSFQGDPLRSSRGMTIAPVSGFSAPLPAFSPKLSIASAICAAAHVGQPNASRIGEAGQNSWERANDNRVAGDHEIVPDGPDGPARPQGHLLLHPRRRTLRHHGALRLR